MSVLDLEPRRRRMVRQHLAARGITDQQVLAAMGSVPREAFIPEHLAEFAYDDTPLPIEEGQTISQPLIVALMIQALELSPTDRVLEIGAGSGYAAAVLSRIVNEVYTVERHGPLAELAAERCRRLGYDNVSVLHGDGTLGWPEHAPFDAVVAAAGGPEVPMSLAEQLVVGGRLVIPIGADPRNQELVRVRRLGEDRYERESLGGVRFVPLVGAEGWSDESATTPSRQQRPISLTPDAAPGSRSMTSQPALSLRLDGDHAVVSLLRECAEPFESLAGVDLDPLLDRIGNRRVVLIGEATHGTSEFYELRAQITRELIERRGFSLVAVEADWPDAAQIDRWVRNRPGEADVETAFTRFPTWMWRNRETRDFVHWLAEHNRGVSPQAQVSFHGLDLYSLYRSIDLTLAYLDRVDPAAARIARERYGCLSPWQQDPALYGRAALSGGFRTCEDQVVANLAEMLERQVAYSAQDGEDYLDAVQNARIVANAERYYRIMYYGSSDSWNLRDRHMFDTLKLLLAFRGPGSKAVVWEHNSHVGDASATEMGARGELNVGLLAREHFADDAYLVGFGTDHGTVAAASNWGEPMEIMTVRPALKGSYERLCHETETPAFLLSLRHPARPEIRDELSSPRLERAIGVIYRPETELQSHYFQAVLPDQFDEYIWLDRTQAVSPLVAHQVSGMPDTYPFGL